jgi:hypothetical protein
MTTQGNTERWSQIDEGKFRSVRGTIWRRARGWYFYPPGTRKAEGDVFKSKAAAIRFANAR